MDKFAITLFALAMLVLQGAAAFAIVYFGARLAIRHERRVSN
ncbi:MAG TPA: hypothetical protein VKI43_13730 [Vicinamibacterales bacterium]|nr:hypothetical protein [Vicinamibacterales bacterium]